MTQNTSAENKSTKDVILDYLLQNRGREIAVSEISEKYDFKLNRISNAIKELEYLGKINIERRPLSKGKYTVISLKGDNIVEFASHEREINPKTVSNGHETENYESEEFPLHEAIFKLNDVEYTQIKFKNFIEPFYDTYFSFIHEVIQPILYEIGEMWRRSEITVADEHLMSARIEKLLIDLISRENKSKRKDRIIILCPVENEFHTVPLLALELLLVELGINVINLSRSISIISIIDFINKMKVKPEWIFFSVTIETYLSNLRIDIKMIKEEFKTQKLKIAIGGQGIKFIDSKSFKMVDRIIKDNNDLKVFLATI
jgi:methanogenic corrinoid protein MtbC1